MNNDVNLNATAPLTLQNNSGVDMSAIIQEWRLASQYVEYYTRDFQSLDDLVDSVPLTPDPKLPFIADTTLPGLVRSIPRDSLEQVPTISVIINGTKNSIAALTATYLLKKYAFNEDTFGKGLLSTLQLGAEQALTHGFAPFIAATGTMYKDFGTKLRLLHFSDIALEPGIADANEQGYGYVVANLTPTRVRKILAKARLDPNTSWNIPALEQVLQTTARPTNYSIYQSDPRRNASGEQAGPVYKFITRKETGAFGKIITFCLDTPDVPLRVLTSKSKFGYPNLMLLVIDPAPLTPFGMSRVRLASPTQNLLNIYYAQIAATLLLNSAPPILKVGRFIKPVQLVRNAVWETNDPQASAKLVSMDNGSLETFVEMAKQLSGQIQNIMARPVGAMNSDGGSNLGFSKTAPGVKQQQQFTDAGTNQITKIMENFLRQYGLISIDGILSEQIGEQDIIVDDDTKNAINQLEPGTIGDDNKLHIDWEKFYAAIEEMSTEVSVSVSKDQLADEKRGDIQDMLTVLAQNAQEIPGAAELVQQLSSMLLEDLVPGVKAPTAQPIAQPPVAPPVAGMPSVAPPAASLTPVAQ